MNAVDFLYVKFSSPKKGLRAEAMREVKRFPVILAKHHGKLFRIRMSKTFGESRELFLVALNRDIVDTARIADMFLFMGGEAVANWNFSRAEAEADCLAEPEIALMVKTAIEKISCAS